MAILFCGLVLLAALPLLMFCKPRNEHAQERQKDPCDKCVRWSECNGVDDDCPLREDVRDAHFEVDTQQLAATMREAVRNAKRSYNNMQ